MKDKAQFRLLIIAGVHGQEPQSSYVLKNIIEDYDKKDKKVFQVYSKETKSLKVIAIPEFNAYGLEHKTRGNKNKVDLNRNLPASNWVASCSNPLYNPGLEPASELETQEFIKIIKEFEPQLIISIHTNHFVTVAHPAQVNFDGEIDSYGYSLAEKLSELIDLELTCDIGYSTPGSLGSYAKDLKIPCITLEFDDDLTSVESLARYAQTLINFIAILGN